MALYSWFTRTNKEPNIQQVNTHEHLVNTAETAKYIERYTMWPTAKIKPTNKIMTPMFKEKSQNTKQVNTTTSLPTGTELAIVKS